MVWNGVCSDKCDSGSIRCCVYHTQLRMCSLKHNTHLFYVGEAESPRLLWSLFYNQEWVTVDQHHCHGNASPLPPNVHMVSDPDLSISYTASIDEVDCHIMTYRNAVHICT